MNVLKNYYDERGLEFCHFYLRIEINEHFKSVWSKYISFQRRDQFSHCCLFEMGNEASVPTMAVVPLTVTSCPNFQGMRDHEEGC